MERIDTRLMHTVHAVTYHSFVIVLYSNAMPVAFVDLTVRVLGFGFKIFGW